MNILNTVDKYINKVYILRDLKRYNNSLKIKDESVAEHSAFVTLIVLELHNYFDFNLEEALITAITHDLTEIYITDIPHNVKNNYPGLKAIIKGIEKEVFKAKFSKRIAELNLDFIEHSTDVANVVELADMLSVKQYTISEINLGNSGSIKEVYEYTVKLIENQYKKLDRIRR